MDIIERTGLGDQSDDKDGKVRSEEVLIEAYWPYDREELSGRGRTAISAQRSKGVWT